MKRKSLSELLKRLENTISPENLEISNLNDQLAKKMLKGGYDTNNTTCGGSNDSCLNTNCKGTSNGECFNAHCYE
jgi:hypothetical protein